MRVITARISCMGILSIFLIITTVTLEPADAVVGFDCENGIQSIRTISLLDIDECDIKEDDVETSYPKIALLNLNEYGITSIIQCKVEIHRTVNNCGTSSHNSVVKGGFSEYMYPITREMCKTAHNSGTLKIGAIAIDGLSVINETRKPITLAGTVNSNGGCTGEQYTDPLGAWDNVFVEGTVKVTLTTQSVKTKVDSDKISLTSGHECKLSDGHCIDSAGGYTFWDALPRADCNTNTYSTLYTERVTKLVSGEETVFSVNVKDTHFALSIVGTESSCGVTIFKTEHPKLFIVEREDFERLYRKGITNFTPDRSEIFRYIDDKFMYVERFKRSQINSLYRDFQKYKCKLEKEILKSTLSIAASQPDQFAYRYMQSPGYIAVLAGEAVHIVQCLPVVVKIRHSNKCYNRLPIERGNQSLFLTPLTHIITNYATELPCNTPLREHYKIEGTWYRLMPRPMSVPSPVVPRIEMNFIYENPVDLENTGVYTEEVLHGMRGRIMFPIEQTVIQQITSQQLTHDMKESASFKDFIDDDLLEKLAENFWSRSWGKFIGFGTICASLVGIFVFVSTIIAIIDTCIHGYALYSVYGRSIYVVGALWDSLAREMLFRGNNNKGRRLKSILPYSIFKEDKKSDVKTRAPDLEKRISSNNRPLKVTMPSQRPDNQFSKCVNELKLTKSDVKPKVAEKPEIKKRPDLKTEVPNSYLPCDVPILAQRPDNQFSKCVNELKLTKSDVKPKVAEKPEIKKRPDLKTEVPNSYRPCDVPILAQRPDNQFSKCVNELKLTKSDVKPKVAEKPEIKKRPDLKTEVPNSYHPCDVPILAQRPDNQFSKCVNELKLTKSDVKPKVAEKPEIKKRPDLKTEVPNSYHPCDVPILAQRPDNQFSKCVNELKLTKSDVKPKVAEKPEIKKRPDLKTEVPNSYLPCDVPILAQRPDNQFSKCVNELKLTKSDVKPKVAEKPEIKKRPDLKTEVPNSNRPCDVPILAQRSINQLSKCISELKATQPDSIPKVDKKPDVMRKTPDLKKGVTKSTDRSCNVLIPAQRPTNQFSMCIRELEGRKGKN